MNTASGVETLLPMAAQSTAGMMNLLLLLLPLLLLVFLFMTQRKRGREVQQLQAALAVGDEVVTTAGLYGRITAIEGDTVLLEVTPGTQLRFDRRAIGMKQPTALSDPAPGEGPAAPDRED